MDRSEIAKNSSFRTSTAPIPAEGSSARRNLARAFVPRPRRSPQRVARAPQESQKNLEFLHLDHADPRRLFIRRAPQKRKTPRVFVPRSSFCTSTTLISAEGCAGRQKSQKNSSLYLHPIPAEGRAGRSKNLEFLQTAQRVVRADQKSQKPRPRKLNSTDIAANAEAALGSMRLALCTWLYALGSTHLALCSRLYALGSAHLLYALGSMHLALCTWLYALGSMHLALRTALRTWTWLYALGSMHSALRTRLYAPGSVCTWLYALGSMHLALCTALCTWLHALGSMHLALCV